MSPLTEIICGIFLLGAMFPVWKEMQQGRHSTRCRIAKGYSFMEDMTVTSNESPSGKKRTAKALDRERYTDIYIVATDFSWTYVHTHEPEFGPYFCQKELFATD
ncbi:MAG: DUF4275 family protein [Oscillospiraceae bacterium]|nr:DUF4275 family protein [Oscillospiraceae bacterium]